MNKDITTKNPSQDQAWIKQKVRVFFIVFSFKPTKTIKIVYDKADEKLNNLDTKNHISEQIISLYKALETSDNRLFSQKYFLVLLD